MSTPGAPSAPQMRRVASTPLIRGMRTSITTTSTSLSWSEVDGDVPVLSFTDDAEIGFGAEDHGESSTHRISLVIDEQNADRHATISDRESCADREAVWIDGTGLQCAAVGADAFVHADQTVSSGICETGVGRLRGLGMCAVALRSRPLAMVTDLGLRHWCRSFR